MSMPRRVNTGGMLALSSDEPVFCSDFEEFVYYQAPAESWDKLLVMLKAYLDESGTHEGASALSLAGFVAGARQWVQLDRSWRAELRREGLEEFHATEFFKDGFNGWGRRKRVEFLDRLTKPVLRLKMHAIGGVVPMASYRRLPEEARRYLTGGAKNRGRGKWVGSGRPSAAYFVVFPFALAKAASYANPGVKVHFYLDRHDQYEGYARDWFSELQELDKEFGDALEDVTFVDSKKHPGIQLADLLAHLLYQMRGRESLDPLQELCIKRLRVRSGENLILFDDYSLKKLLSGLPEAVRATVLSSFAERPTES